MASERTRLPAKAVYLIGTRESVETPMVSQMADFTSSRAFRVAGPKAFAEAGITHNAVDHLIVMSNEPRCAACASGICVVGIPHLQQRYRSSDRATGDPLCWACRSGRQWSES